MSLNNFRALAAALACVLMTLAGCSKPAGQGPAGQGQSSPPQASPSPQPQAAPSVLDQAATAEAWQRDMNRLKALGAAYHARIDATGKAPAGWGEVKQGAQTQGISELESEGWVVAWGKHFRDAPQGTSQFVLAYSPKGLQEEGYVLFLDGAVSRLPPEELKAKLTEQGGAPAAP